MEIKHLTDEQVREILEKYYPNEQWDGDEEDCRICLIERANPGGNTETCDDGFWIRYTNIVDPEW